MNIRAGKDLLRKLLGERIYNLLSLVRRTAYISDCISYHFIRWRVLSYYGKWAPLSERSVCNDRKMPHILMLAEKWSSGNPLHGPCSVDWVFFGSLEASGLATYVRLNRDEHTNRYSFEKTALGICMRKKPDLLFSTMWLVSSLDLKTLKVIRESLHIPVIATWPDIENHVETAEALVEFVDFNLVLNSVVAPIRSQLRDIEKYIRLWSAFDPRVFYNANLKRDINVSFVGLRNGHPDREEGISVLKAHGIEVYVSGGKEEKTRLSVEEYAAIYRRSKIALNFCYHANGIFQLKGRVFEATSCGSMLMETENPETAKYFEPMIDYVPFSDNKDLVDKVRYYLAHDDEREEIAANGHRKVTEKYNCRIFWQKVLDKALGKKSQ